MSITAKMSENASHFDLVCFYILSALELCSPSLCAFWKPKTLAAFWNPRLVYKEGVSWPRGLWLMGVSPKIISQAKQLKMKLLLFVSHICSNLTSLRWTGNLLVTSKNSGSFFTICNTTYYTSSLITIIFYLTRKNKQNQLMPQSIKTSKRCWASFMYITGKKIPVDSKCCLHKASIHIIGRRSGWYGR